MYGVCNKAGVVSVVLNVNNQPSFRGMYIIKGVAKDVQAAKKVISEHCGIEAKKLSDKIDYQLFQKTNPVDIEYYPNFVSMNFINLTPIVDTEQPLVHTLISTNEHTPNVVNWYMTMQPPEKDELREKMQKLRVRNTPSGTVVSGDISGIINGLQKKINGIREEMRPYYRAKEAAKRGNQDLMSDFIIDMMVLVKQRLQEIRDLAIVSYKEPKILEAEEVINAILDKRFNFITGEIK